MAPNVRTPSSWYGPPLLSGLRVPLNAAVCPVDKISSGFLFCGEPAASTLHFACCLLALVGKVLSLAMSGEDAPDSVPCLRGRHLHWRSIHPCCRTKSHLCKVRSRQLEHKGGTHDSGSWSLQQKDVGVPNIA